MTTITIKQFIHMERDSRGNPRYCSYGRDMSKERGFGMLVGETEFQYTIPADFDPIFAETSALQKQKEELTREFTRAVKAINERLSNLQAIGYEQEAT